MGAEGGRKGKGDHRVQRKEGGEWSDGQSLEEDQHWLIACLEPLSINILLGPLNDPAG